MSDAFSEPVSEPVSEKPLPGMRRGRGRPPGSRNKVGKTAMDLISMHGKGAIESLCAIAAGHVVYSAPDDEGKRKRLEPTLAERLMACRIIADKLVPTLKSSEVAATVNSDMTIRNGEAADMDVAKVLLGVLHDGRSPAPPETVAAWPSQAAVAVEPTISPDDIGAALAALEAVQAPEAAKPEPIPEPLPSDGDGPIAGRLRLITTRPETGFHGRDAFLHNVTHASGALK